MPSNGASEPTTGHPAPQRRRVGLLALGFAVAGAPTVWALLILINYSLASYACFPHDIPRAAPILEGTWWILLIVGAVSVIGSVIAGAVAYRAWCTTRTEHAGHAHRLLETGEGRTRFLALWGLLFSPGFLVVIAFVIAALFLVPLCI